MLYAHPVPPFPPRRAENVFVRAAAHRTAAPFRNDSMHSDMRECVTQFVRQSVSCMRVCVRACKTYCFAGQLNENQTLAVVKVHNFSAK